MASRSGHALSPYSFIVSVLFTFVVLGISLSGCGGGGGGKGSGGGGNTLSPAIQLSATSVSFAAPQPVQTSTTGSITATNSGTASLSITGISISGAQPGDFTVTSPSFPASVSPGSNVSIQFKFTPGAVGGRSASASIASNASNVAPAIALSGTGWDQAANASITLTPNSNIDTTNQINNSPTISITGLSTSFWQGTAQGSSQADFGPGIVVGSNTGDGPAPLSVTNSTSATVGIQVKSAAAGPRQVTVSTNGHTSTATFFVHASNGPQANAGTAQVVAVGATVHLDGSGTTVLGGAGSGSSLSGPHASDSSSSALTYNWSFITVPTGSNAALTDPTAVDPTFVADKNGDYIVKLTVSDGTNSTESSVMASTNSVGPVANAGPNQFVTTGSKVQLDGSKSFDASGNTLSYNWSLVSVPSGSAASLSDPQAVMPTFVADMSGSYLVQLTVSDGKGNTSSAQVTVSTQTVPPIADAGPNQSVTAGSTVQLDASNSKSPMGDILTYLWKFNYLPANSQATLSDPTLPNPTFTADLSGTYVLQVAVTDSHTNTSFATVLISTNPIAPVAVAGPAQTVNMGATVQLDGSGSSSDNGTPSYQWSLLSVPAGSKAALSANNKVNPTFVADTTGSYVAQLVVSDGTLSSVPSTVLITAIAPGLALSPGSVVFGNQLVSTTSASTPVTITSSGTASLTINAITISGANAGDFALSGPALPITLSPGLQTTINVTFTPSGTGDRAASLNITDNAGSSPQSLSLAGTGTAPTMGINPAALAFGKQGVGTPGTLPLSILNSGTGDLNITSIAISGANASDFSYTSSQLPIKVAAGGSATISVTFQPPTTGDLAAVLSITDNATGSPQAVNLTGTGVQPGITLSATSLTFAGQLVGSTSSPQTLTITNSGTADLNISNVSLTGPNASAFGFVPASQLPIKVSAGATTTVNVTFSPTATGGANATLSVTSNAPGSPNSVTLSGTGTQPTLSLSASSLTFADTQVGSTSQAQTLTISNTGTADLIISSLAISGTNSAEFTFSSAAPTLPLTISAGKNTSVNFVFSPKGGGARSAVLTVGSNAGPAQSVTFQGTGLVPNIGISPQNGILPFGNVRVGTTSTPLTVTVTNTGTGSLTLSGIVLGGSNPGDFAFTSSTLPITVDPGKSTTISATFQPLAADVGPRTATITISHNAAGGTTVISLTGTGTAPAITVTPASPFDFGSVLLGSASPVQTFTIQNTGMADLHVSAITLTNTASSEFTMVAPATPLVITAGTSSTFTVSLKPSQLGLRTGGITITSDASTSPTAIGLQGTGVAPAFSASPSPLAFGNQPKNQPNTLPLTVTNSGTAPLTVSQISITGTNASAFTFTPPTLPFTVAAGKTATVTVTFTPTTAGNYSATLTFTDNAADSPQSVSLSGTGTTVGFSPSAPSFTFGPQLVKTASSPQSLVITNNGNANLVITNLQLTGTNPGDYSVSAGTLPITVTPNQSTTITLTFTPKAAGASSASLQVTDNADGSPQSFGLSGTGIQPAVTLSATQISFASQLSGTASSPQTVTVTNSGTADLVITSVSVSGANAGDFALTTATLPITVHPNNTTGISIVFTPGAAGSRTATLSIVDNAPDTPQSVALTGTGTAPVFSVTPPSLTFGSQPVNTTSQPQSVTIKNTGTADLHVSNITITGTNAADFAFSAVTPITVAAGQSTSVAVTFTPSGATTASGRSATVQFTDDAAGSPHSVSLSGTANATSTLSMPAVTVGQNLEFNASVVVTPAASSNMSVVVTSLDPSKVLLSTDPTLAGTASITVTIPQGSGFSATGFWVQALVPSGTVQLSLVAPGSNYTPGAVTLTPSAVLISGPGAPGGDFTSGISSDTTLTLATYRLNPNLSLITSNGQVTGQQKLRGGLTASVAVTSGTTTVGTIVGSPLMLTGGALNGSLTFHPVGPGTSLLTAVEPAGFSTPTSGSTLNATVSGPKVLLNPVTVGANLEAPGTASLDTAAPTGGLTVTISSNNSSVLLSADPTAMGSTSIQLPVAASSTVVPPFYVQALAGSGSAQLSGSATGYTTATANVLMTPSAFLIAGPGGTPGQAFSTTTISANSTLILTPWRLDSSGNPSVPSRVRGGFSVSVPVVSGTSATGTVVGTATFMGGDSSNSSLAFQPLAAGSSALSVTQPTGFFVPTSNGTVTVTVTAPAVTIGAASSVVGANLQVLASGSLNTAAPAALTVHIASNSSAVLLSATPTGLGSSAIDLIVPAGQGLQGSGFPPFYVQGTLSTGSATLTATVTSQNGWTSSQIPITLAPSGFVLTSSNGIGADFGTIVGQNTTLHVQSAQLDPVSHAVVNLQQLRGGTSVSIAVNSQNTVVGTIVGSPFLFNGGDQSDAVSFAAAASGSTQLSVPAPSGFTAPANGATLNANVN